MLEWVMKSDAAGDIGFWISNKSTENLLLKIEVEFRECTVKTKWRMERIFEPSRGWGNKQLFTKDVLDNKIDTLTDGNGHLNIHLKICCKRHIFQIEALNLINFSLNLVLQKGSTATKRVYEPGLNNTDEEVQSKR